MKRITTIFYLFFGCMALGHAQNLGKVKLDNKLSILNDRVFFNFPSEAKNEVRSVNIMSADPNKNMETRIVYDNGDKRLVFFAQELFALGDADFQTSVEKIDVESKLNTKRLLEKDSMLAILSTPTRFNENKSAILVNALTVRMPDNTVFRIAAYINPSAFKWKDQYQELTENIFASLSKGTRQVNLQAKKEKIDIFGTKKSFVFSLPANYAVTMDQQYDFQVFKLHKYQPFSGNVMQQFIIYVGNHPSMVYRDYGVSENDAQKMEGNFLGNKVTWLLFDLKNQGFYNKEQLVNADNIEKGLLVHIAMMSTDEALIDEFTKIAESIELEK